MGDEIDASAAPTITIAATWLISVIADVIEAITLKTTVSRIAVVFPPRADILVVIGPESVPRHNPSGTREGAGSQICFSLNMRITWW